MTTRKQLSRHEPCVVTKGANANKASVTRIREQKVVSSSLGDWTEVSFAVCFEPLRNNTYSRAAMTPTVGVANIHYGDVLVKYGEVLDFATADVPSLLPGTASVGDELRDGDIVIADTAEDETCGRTVEIANLDSRKAVAGLHTIACRPKPGLFVPGWLGYYMNSVTYHRQLVPLMAGIKVLSLSRNALSTTTISIPPLSEQRRIAAILSTADRVIAGKERLLEAKRTRKRALMQKLLNPGTNGDSAFSRVGAGTRKEGRISQTFVSWKRKSFSECFSPLSTRGHQIQTNDYLKSGSYPVVDQGEKKFVGFSNDQTKVLHCPQGGVIVFGDHTRNVKFINEDFIVGADGTKLLVSKKDSTEFLFHLLLSIHIPNTGYNRHFKYLKSLTFLVPPLPTQHRIVDILSVADCEIDGLVREINAWKEKRKALSQLLLSGKVRV